MIHLKCPKGAMVVHVQVEEIKYGRLQMYFDEEEVRIGSDKNSQMDKTFLSRESTGSMPLEKWVGVDPPVDATVMRYALRDSESYRKAIAIAQRLSFHKRFYFDDQNAGGHTILLEFTPNKFSHEGS